MDPIPAQDSSLFTPVIDLEGRPLARVSPLEWLAWAFVALLLLVCCVQGWRGVGLLVAMGLVFLSLKRYIPSWTRDLITAWKQGSLDWILPYGGLAAAGVGILFLLGITQLDTSGWNWEAIGALGETFGAAGQILIAVLAAYIAWRQYIISKELTAQQNTITQQQTIDAYFDGISGMIVAEDGQLDDWPLERAIAEGRTAAIMGGVDRLGKAKILRFLSVANLLTPLRRDSHLGRPILDGSGGYQKDRNNGIRVVYLGDILERADLHGTELRGIDFSEVSLEGADLRGCDLSYANLIAANLMNAQLQGADLYKAQLFEGTLEGATPANRYQKPHFKSGAHTGAIIEGANFRGVTRLSLEQRQYICAWGGPRSRATVPGGCVGIPDQLTMQQAVQASRANLFQDKEQDALEE
jgi:uncharacterized protein YjbI with pentapeptide repeats